MFIAKILFANVLVPIIVSAVSAGLAGLARRFSPRASTNDKPDSTRERHDPAAGSSFQFVAGAFAAAVSVWLAFSIQNGFAVYPEDAWLRVPQATFLVAAAAVISAPLHAVVRWIVRIGVLMSAAWIIFPTGEGWEFLLQNRNFWLATITGGSFVAWLSIEFCSFRQAAVLGFSWIPCLAATAYLTSQSFMRVTEPLMAVASVIGCSSIAVLLARQPNFLRGAAGPSLLAFAAFAASAQFNSYLGLSDYLSGLAIVSPSLVCACTLPWIVRRPNERPGGDKILPMVLVAIIVSLCAVASIVVWTQIAAGGGEEEW